MDRSGFSRRGFLKGVAAVGGAAIGTRIAGRELIGDAQAASPPDTFVLIIHLVGGFNALFPSAGSFMGAGTFGVTAGNVRDLGNGQIVDRGLYDGLGAYAVGNTASVGFRHGSSSHGTARGLVQNTNNQSGGLVLADAMGGNGSLKAVSLGGDVLAETMKTPVNGTSWQSIRDMQTTINAIGGGAPNPRLPDRGITLGGVQGADDMSKDHIARHAKSLASLKNGFNSAIDTLKQPKRQFSFADLSTAYQLNNNTAVRDFKSKMAAAELMAFAGTNVAYIGDGGWDTHGDRTGTTVRNKMNAMVPFMKTFLDRMSAVPNSNPVIAIVGDFSRSLPGSDHAPGLSAFVVSRNAKQGTTGATDANVRLPANTPTSAGFWSYLAAITKSGTSAFGANPHTAITK
jgi:hypothetical protein